MKKLQKIVSLILIVSLLSVNCFAGTNKSGDLSSGGETGVITWSLDSDGVLTISGNGKMRSFHNNYTFEGICNDIKSIVIEDGVENIGSYVFGLCEKMNSISIPVSVTEIGDNAFENATFLSVVYYAGTKQQWDEISIGTSNICLNNATVKCDAEPHQHIMGEWKVVSEPTCVGTGIKLKECIDKDCDYSITEPISATGVHTYEWSVKEPTCTQNGVKTQMCTVCKKEGKTEVVKATGHQRVDWETDKEPTCTESGLNVIKCTFCGAILDEKVVKATGHDFGEWKTTTKETEEKNGEETRTCKSCKFKETRVIDNIKTPINDVVGDANGDGSVTATDARLVLQVVAGLKENKDLYFSNADVNDDNKLTATDARKILRIVAELD